ncbi:MAG: hypothetical protein ACLQGP_00150 [Isosphaeraceae bacterium]
MDLLRKLIGSLGFLLLAPLIAPPAPAAQPPGPSAPPGSVQAAGTSSQPRGEVRSPSDRHDLKYYVILDSPRDLNELLRKIRHPDLEIKQVDRPMADGILDGLPDELLARPSWVVESVRVRGRVVEEFAILQVLMTIETKSEGPSWIPIRLDDQKLSVAREGSRELALRTTGRSRWQVELTGRGRHLVEVDLRAAVMAKPARNALALAIPEAASTSIDLEFARRESDIIVGTNEVFQSFDLPDGKGTRLTAQLYPRSKVEVSWANDAEAGGHDPPLLTAQGEIALDIDPDQMWIRSSWKIRCVRGMSRTLEIRVDDRDEVTELRLDDQQTDAAGIEGARGSGRLTIRLGEPLRPDAPPRRLVMKTRRSYSKAPGRRIEFVGFRFTNAREQSGAIGITHSPNLWINASGAQGVRPIELGGLPVDLRERPSTSLAFEFLDQPFALHLDVEDSPPLVRARTRTQFQIGADVARSRATIELERVRGRLFEVELGIGPGLQVISVGPSEMVEGWNLVGKPSGRGPAGAEPIAQALKIRLTSLARDQTKGILRLEGYQRIPGDGPAKLGLFAPDPSTSVAASYELTADRRLSVELDDVSGQFTRATEPISQVKAPSTDRASPSPPGGTAAPPLIFASSGAVPSLPIRITRHARSVVQQTVLSANLSRRLVDVVQETTLVVRHGTLDSLEVRVPAAVADYWEILDREIVDREELGRDPDGSRRYQLVFDRPVLEKTLLRFRLRLPIVPHLDAVEYRGVAIPWISFEGAVAGLARFEVSSAPGILYQADESGWISATEDGQPNRSGEAATSTFNEVAGGPGGPFKFKALALDPVELPPLVVPRLLIRSVNGLDGAIRSRARYWVETHGPVFSFALPEGARWIAARVDGRVSDQVDSDATRPGYRLRFPPDVASRPVLVELEYQVNRPADGSSWQAPELLDGGIVLDTLWEVELPWDRAIVGVPRGWSDENEWYWTGRIWKRRTWKDGAALDQWLGGTAASSANDELREASLDDSHHLLFSRSGPPIAMSIWIASRTWIVVVCSGLTLILGFLAIFTRIRFRTAWAVAAGLAILAAAFWHPSVTLMVLQSAFMGVALTSLALVIERLLDRKEPPPIPARDSGPSSVQTHGDGDSALDKPAPVGSDDSTAIRVRVASTIDFVPAPIEGALVEESARSSTLGRD